MLSLVLTQKGKTMKVTRKANKSKATTLKATNSNPFVAMGDRGTSCLEMHELPAPLVLGRQPILAKQRGGEDILWKASCSWIQSSRAVDDDGVARFTILDANKAIKQKAVKLLKGVKFQRVSDKKTFTGDLLMPANWNEGQKQPRVVAVMNAKGYPHGRIESKPVAEKNGAEARNRHLVCKILWK